MHTHRVWDGAVVLAQYLSSNSSPLHQYRAERRSKQTVTPDGSSGSINRAAGELDGGPSSSSSSTPLDCSALDPSLQQPLVSQPQSCTAGQHCSMPIGQSNLQPAQHVPEPPLQEQLQQKDVEQPDQPLHGLTCLELGAGTGAVSLSVLAAGVVDYAVLTDIPDMLPHLQSNVEHNSAVLDSRRALVLPLRWAEAADVGALQQLGQQQHQQWRPRRGPVTEPVGAPQVILTAYLSACRRTFRPSALSLVAYWSFGVRSVCFITLAKQLQVLCKASAHSLGYTMLVRPCMAQQVFMFCTVCAAAVAL